MSASAIVSPEELSFIESGVESSVRLLEAIAAEFQPDPSDESQYWVARVQDAKKQLVNREVVIGVAGATGVGKSKFINALLRDDLLSISELQACTAAPIEISYNKSKSYEHRAVIEFMTAEDWLTEMNILIDEISTENTPIDWDSISSGNLGDVAQLAFDKLSAVYPQILAERPAQLSIANFSTPKIMDLLGQKIVVERNNIEEFRSVIESYVVCQLSGGSGGSFHLWPLIRKVQIYTKAPILESGVRLVDLPGVNDNNTAREAVARQYLEQCTSVLVMAPVVRARNDKTALGFLHTFIGKQLRLNGTLHHVAFVCTKTGEGLSDDNEQREALAGKLRRVQIELIETKKKSNALDEEHAKLRSRLELLYKRQATSESDSKRKTVDDEIDDNKRVRQKEPLIPRVAENFAMIDTEELSKPCQMSKRGESSDQADDIHKHIFYIDEERKKLASRLLKLQEDKKLVEIQHSRDRIQNRNENARSAIREDFLKGLDKTMVHVEKCSARLQNHVPEVFCIDSDAYLRLFRDADDEKVHLNGFLNEKDTGVPDLAQHCRSFATDLRLKSVARYVTAVHELLNSMNLWAIESLVTRQLSEEDRSNAEIALSQTLERLEEDITDILTRLLEKRIYKLLNDAQHKAICACANICKNWNSIHWRTYCAVIARGGAFTSSLGKTYDFNEELGNVMYNAFSARWDRFFNDKIPETVTIALAKCQEVIKNFTLVASQQLNAVGATSNSLKILQSQSFACAKILEAHFGDAERALMEKRKSRKKLFVTVHEMMGPGYAKASTEKGTHKMERIRPIIALHLTRVQQQMYSKAVDEIRSDLKSSLGAVGIKLRNDIKRAAQNVIQDYRRFLTTENKDIRKQQLKHIQAIYPLIQNFGTSTLNDVISILGRLGYDHFRAAVAGDDAKNDIEDSEDSEDSEDEHKPIIRAG